MFALTIENTERIKNQNDRQISVIIGNPPYNAKQENFNQNNANRFYQSIDKRIKETYVKYGKAQNKIVLYDMYTRFIRWASDRLNKDGIIAFITNSSFLDAHSFDGFRKCIENEFAYAYFIDCGGNVRKISGKDGIFICEKHTIFGTAAMTGIAILFLVKDSQTKNSKIFYANPFHIHELRDNKLSYISSNKLQSISFDHIIPDNKYNWLNQSDNDFDELLPLIDKEVKSGRSQEAVFKLFSRGIVTQRDEWVYDFSQNTLESKVKFLIEVYQETLKDNDYADRNLIKWDRELNKYLQRNINKQFDNDCILKSLYRPYTYQYFYFDKHFNGMTYQWFNIYKNNDKNNYISIPGIGSSKPFQCLATTFITCLDFLEKTQCLPLYYYDENGNQIDNITDWGLEKFREYYNTGRGLTLLNPETNEHTRGSISLNPETNEHTRGSISLNPETNENTRGSISLNPETNENTRSSISLNPETNNEGSISLNSRNNKNSRGLTVLNPYDEQNNDITKEDIFYYVYAVLHNPEYRKKYELNLKRDFPRLPLYDNFFQWVKWGQKLMELHINYETVNPYPLNRIDIPLNNENQTPKPKLKADKTKGQIIIDDVTILEGIPLIAWEYKLGNRCALEWVLDQYKEKKPKDKTIAEKFNNYQFVNYKEQVIDLLAKVCCVSVETMKIIQEMEL